MDCMELRNKKQLDLMKEDYEELEGKLENQQRKQEGEMKYLEEIIK